MGLNSFLDQQRKGAPSSSGNLQFSLMATGGHFDPEIPGLAHLSHLQRETFLNYPSDGSPVSNIQYSANALKKKKKTISFNSHYTVS